MKSKLKKKAEDWNALEADEAYKLSVAEFRGTTIQALQDIRGDIAEIKQDAKVRNWIVFGISGLTALIASVLTTLGMKH